MVNELWKPMENYEDYLISNLGRVKSLKHSKERIISQRINKSGYYYFNPCKKGKYKSTQVHYLVAQNFVPGYKQGLIVNHKDTNKKNNNFSNLEWVTIKGNAQHALKKGLLKTRRGSFCNLSKLKESDVIQIKELREMGLTHLEIAKKYKVSRGTISQILSGTIWKHL